MTRVASTMLEMRAQPPVFVAPLMRAGLFLLALIGVLSGGGCASIRVTDPYQTATEQFLMTGAAEQAVAQLSMDGLRDHLAYVDTANLLTDKQAPQFLFLVGALRARLLREGVRLTIEREQADTIVEVRSGGLGVDRYEYLLGIPSLILPANTSTSTGTNINTPELAIIKSTKQRGFGSVAIVAYRAKTGEMIAQSGPFIGRTLREDFWFFGVATRPLGNIAPVEQAH